RLPVGPEAPPALVEEAPPKSAASPEEAAKATTPVEEASPPAAKDEAQKVVKEAEGASPASEETQAPHEEGKAPTEEAAATGAGAKPPANDNAPAETEGQGKLRSAGIDDAMSELHKTLPEGPPERESLEAMPGFGVGEREQQNPLVIEPGSGKEAVQAQVKERLQGYEQAMQAQVEAAMGNDEVKGRLLEAFGPQLRGQLCYEES